MTALGLTLSLATAFTAGALPTARRWAPWLAEGLIRAVALAVMLATPFGWLMLWDEPGWPRESWDSWQAHRPDQPA